ncbi:XdhC family protein [Streptomyces sp. NPDC006465]|uniref:XdhC family protein n=1 Tax=Streptomyces sp. NPDC006465 TaxID=3157174 RepID=UPI0033B304E9
MIASGEARLETFGYSDADAFAVGLTCGGEITLLVRRVSPADDPAFGALAESVAAGRPVTVATVLDGPAPRGATLAVWPQEEPGPPGGGAAGAPGGATRPGATQSATTGEATAEAAGQVTAGKGDGATAGPVTAGKGDGATAGPVTAGKGDGAAPGMADLAAAGETGGVAADATEPAATGEATAEAAGPVTAGKGDEVVPGVAGVGVTESGVVGRVAGSLGSAGLDVAVSADARGELAQGATGQRHYGPRGERREDAVTVFLHSFAPPPRMLVFGAIDYAAAVARIGDFLGYRVTVCDARPVFATPRRFPAGVEVVVDWPHRYLSGTATDPRTVICVLTHDPKFDVPLLEEALRRPAAYIGAMGSRRTHDDRVERLLASGVSERELSRLRSPVGLDLGARTPEEVAVSVAAEIVALRWGGSGMPLTATGGAIHPR